MFGTDAALGGALLAALAAVGYSAGDLATVRAVQRVNPAVVAFWAPIVAGLPVLAIAALAGPPPALESSLLAVGAGAVAGVGVVAYFFALRRGAASIVAPLAATGILLPVAVGVARGDRAILPAAIGTLVVLAGATALARARDGADDRHRLGGGTLALALTAAAGFGGYFVLVDVAVGTGGGGAALWTAGLVLIGSALPAVPGVHGLRTRAADLRLPATSVRGVLVLGALLAAADLALTLAFSVGDVALVSVVAASDPIITVLAAHVLFAEHLSRRQILGVATALGGVLVVAAA